MNNDHNTITINELLLTSKSFSSCDIMDANNIKSSRNNPFTTVSADEESYNTLSNQKNVILINLNYITPTGLLESSISILIPNSSGTKPTKIYLKKENKIFTLVASTGQTITLGDDSGKKSPLKANKFGKFADLELIFLYLILRLSGKHVNYNANDGKIKDATKSYLKAKWKI